MLKKDFWYDLPKELIAQEPADPRDYFMWRMLSEMRKERNGDEYKEIRRASCSIEKPQNG